MTAFKSDNSCILSINGGSSSIKFALFDTGEGLSRIMQGAIEDIGQSETVMHVKGLSSTDSFSQVVTAPTYKVAVGLLLDWLHENIDKYAIRAIGHRVVHGGPLYSKPEKITPIMLAELRRLSPFDPAHLPEEILLIEAFAQAFPGLQQVACFDTAFHHDLPREARILPIPRHFEGEGIRRYGFHGISYAYLMGELARITGTDVAPGRIILCHLGNGASLAAVKDGKPIDTSMSFTPTAGIPMGTRSGDLDPGLFWYLTRNAGLDAESFNKMVNTQSGLLGISGISADMRVLLEQEAQDYRAAEAVTIFCYQVRKWIGSFAAALGGLDTLVFAGGIGENAPRIRVKICEDLGFLGIELDQAKNAQNETRICTQSSRVDVHVLHTDEARMIAKSVAQFIEHA